MTSLPLVIDTVSQEEHHKMDALVEDFLDQLQCPRSPCTTHQLALVLYGVFLIWPEGLNEPMTFRKFLDVVDSGKYGERKALEDALKYARLAGDYNAIRRIGSLRPPNIPLVEELTKIAFERAARLSDTGPPRAWQEPYEGEAVISFFSALNSLYKNQIIHVIQSSGTGKSRMMDEVAKWVFAIPICLRSDNDSAAFPKSDKSIRDFLLVHQGKTIREVKRRYALFLISLFSVVAEEARRMVADLTDHVTLAHQWRKYLQADDMRKRLYDKVISLAKQKMDDQSASDISTMIYCVRKAVSDLVTIIPARHPGSVRVIVYIDEAQFLLDQVAEDEEYWSLSDGHQILCDILERLNLDDISTTFLSAAPGLVTDRSGFARSVLERLFLDLPFDFASKSVVAEGRHCLVEICEDKFMIRFGRRLWLAQWPNSHSPQERIKFMRFVGNALTCRGCTCTNPKLACLGVRILIEFEKSRHAINMEEHLVAKHMRLLFGVPSHRNFPWTGYMSEPILAEAAARILALDASYDAEPGITSILVHLVDDGILQRGERGELAARLVLTLAHDHALESLVCKGELPIAPWEVPKPLTEDELQAAKFLGRLHYSQPIPVCAFLASLLGPDWMDAVLQCYPDNAAASNIEVSLGEAFRHAFIHFTHFGYAEDTSILNDEGCWLAMTRGMAWQCISLKEPVDMVIPIFMGDKESDKLDRLKMTALLIQTTAHPWDKMRRRPVDANSLSFFTPRSDATDRRPYISVIMNLGTCSLAEDITVDPQPPATTALSVGSAHPRYSLTIDSDGLNDAVTHEELFHLVTPQTDLYGQHQKPEWSASPIRAVEQMKPIWRKGNGCFDWAQVAKAFEGRAGNVSIHPASNTKSRGVIASSTSADSPGAEQLRPREAPM